MAIGFSGASGRGQCYQHTVQEGRPWGSVGALRAEGSDGPLASICQSDSADCPARASLFHRLDQAKLNRWCR